MVDVSLRQNPMGATHQNALTAVLPTSCTPLWARPEPSPGPQRPASPWDEWTIPPIPAAWNATHITRRPSPHPTRPSEPSEPFQPWRIEFDCSDTVDHPEYPIEGRPQPSTAAKRLILLLGLAYLFLAALATGLAWTSFADAPEGREPEEEPDNSTPPPARPPERHPSAPGLHTRPDGSRYLVMPLPSDITDRLRGQAPAVALGGGAA